MESLLIDEYYSLKAFITVEDLFFFNSNKEV